MWLVSTCLVPKIWPNRFENIGPDNLTLQKSCNVNEAPCQIGNTYFAIPQIQICTEKKNFKICQLWILINRYHVYELLLTIVMFVFYQVPTHTSVFINEPKLSDFKQVLTKEGLMAEFSGGVLVCNNLVAIRKVSRHLCWRLQLQIISFSNCHVCVFWGCLPCLSCIRAYVLYLWVSSIRTG